MKNFLLVYRGGGYDGCIYEFNLCLWDTDGKWHNVFSSGRCGFVTEKEAIMSLDNDVKNFVVKYGGELGNYEMFDISSKKDMGYFRDNYNPSLLFKFVEYCGTFGILHEMLFKCHMCSKEGQEPEDFRGCNESGDGGLVISSKDIICTECDGNHRCGYCGEWYDDPEKFDQEGYCPSCHEKEIKNQQFHLDVAVKQNDWKNIDRWNRSLRLLIGLDECRYDKHIPEQMWFIFGNAELK